MGATDLHNEQHDRQATPRRRLVHQLCALGHQGLAPAAAPLAAAAPAAGAHRAAVVPAELWKDARMGKDFAASFRLVEPPRFGAAQCVAIAIISVLATAAGM